MADPDRIGRASAFLASGTIVSRILGFVKAIVLAAAIGVVTSVISLYYYLQVMRQAFVSKPEEGAEPLRVPFEMQGLAAGLMIAVFYVGLYPQQLFDAVHNATGFLFV